VKVELYALIASMLSLVQVFLVVYQMNHSSTQAQASKISLVSLFGQVGALLTDPLSPKTMCVIISRVLF
jgi:hypothetical protein